MGRKKRPKTVELVLHQAEAEQEAGRPPQVIVVEASAPRAAPPLSCAQCHGPVFLCQGRHEASESHEGALERRVAAGLRAAYIGVLLTGVAPAERLGGVLLSSSRVLLEGVDLLATRFAAHWTDPVVPHVGPLEVAARAFDLVQAQSLDEGVAFRLRTVLTYTEAPYLLEACSAAVGAARDSPVTARSTRDLIALLCETCAHATDLREADRLAAAEEYDRAVICWRCFAEHEHPFGRRFERRIHAVARCFGEETCRQHNELLTHGLCDKGRSIYQGAYEAMASKANRSREPWEDRLLAALARAKKREDFDRIAAELRPFNPFMDALGRALNAVTERILPKPPKKSRLRLGRGQP